MSQNEDFAPSSNKLAIIQVLAALIKNPLLFMDNRYHFSIDDFPEQFHRILFGAIQHLAASGMNKIDYIDIDQFLKPYTVQYTVFCANNGITYIQKALNIADDQKFDYYYNTLKKYSLLNVLEKNYISTKDIYDPSIVDPRQNQEQQTRFDDMTVNDILDEVEVKVINAKEQFGHSDDLIQNSMSDGLSDLVEELKGSPEMGLPLISPKLTTIYRGQRLGCLYMESAPSGTGKTRRAVSEACHLAVPEYYDTDTKKWVRTGLAESVLIIETELELKEVQTMALAFVSGVNENKILDGHYSDKDHEPERIAKAIELIQSSQLYVVAITNFDTEDIINVIKKYHQIHDVCYVYYDYLSESLKIMAESSRKTRVPLRTDQILLSMATELKNCAKQFGIYIWTATQLSGDYKNAKELDAGYLRSAKSLSDKVDVGSIMMNVRESDSPVIDTYTAKGFEVAPNFVISVYKIRRGSYQNIRVYVYFDRATCQMHDCFVTDNKGEILPVADSNVEILLDQTKEEKFEKAYLPDNDALNFDDF